MVEPGRTFTPDGVWDDSDTSPTGYALEAFSPSRPISTGAANQTLYDQRPAATDPTGRYRSVPSTALAPPLPGELIAPAEATPASGQVREPTADDRRWRSADWLAVLALFVLSFALVGLHVRKYTQLSPTDELQHLDYAEKASRFEFPGVGDHVGQEAMAEAACRGVDAPNYVGPPCGLDEYDPSDFQEAGVNTAAEQFPIYYLITGLTARGLVSLGLVDSFLVGARMVGAVWLASAFALLWYTFAIIRVTRWHRAAILSVFVATPLLVFHSATVNPDAMLFFGGALITLATVKFAGAEWGWFRLLPVLVLTYFAEPTHTLMIGAAMLFLVLDAIRRSDRRPTQWLIPIIVIVGVGALRWRYGAWIHDQLFPVATQQGALGPGDGSAVPAALPDRPVTNQRLYRQPQSDRPLPAGIRRASVWQSSAGAPVTPPRQQTRLRIDPEDLAFQVPRTFMPIGSPYVPPFMNDGYTYLTINLANWLTIALSSITALAVRGRARLTLFGSIVLFTCLVAGPIYTFYYAYFGDVFFPAQARFGLPLLAAVVLISGAALSNRLVSIVTATIGVAVITNAFWHLLV